MKMLWIYLSLAIVAILVITGVGMFLLFKGDEEPETEKDGKVITVLKRDTLRIAETIYGEVNVSYLYFRESDGVSSADRYNITVKIQYPSEDIYYLDMEYRLIEIDGRISGYGKGSMKRGENGTYYMALQARTQVWDIWIGFYEKGAQVWDEGNQTYFYRGYRTEIIPVILSDIHTTAEMEKNIVISDIHFAFDMDSMNRFNITFHISSQSEARTILVNYDMDLKSDGDPARREIEYGSLGNGNYFATFDISDEEKDDLRFLHFSVSASNAEQMRVSSQVFKVPFS
jgi:hypothetical protein